MYKAKIGGNIRNKRQMHIHAETFKKDPYVSDRTTRQKKDTKYLNNTAKNVCN